MEACDMLTRGDEFSWRGVAKRDSLPSGLFQEDRDGGERRSREFWRRAAAKKGQQLLAGAVLQRTVTLARLGGDEAGAKAAWRFLHNERVSEAALIAAARDHLLSQVHGRRVLVIQDTSEINFSRHQRSKSRFGRGGNGNDPAFFIHPALAVDGESGVILGLADVQLWERRRPARPDKRARATAEKESRRWLAGAEAAAGLRAAGATSVTVVADREGDLYPAFARRPDAVELLVRAQTDRALADGGHLFAHLDALPIAERFTLDLPAVPGRAARQATMVLRHGPVCLRRPKDRAERDLPENVDLYALDVREIDAPANVDPVHWRLLSSAPIDDNAAAHRAIADYRRRWHIEQLFRTVKSQGLGLEESQVADPAALRKLALIALRAAVVCLQLVHARDGADKRPATATFCANDIHVLEALAPTVDGRTVRLSNPFPPHSLPWAAWIIARLGGWLGARNGKPPGPITMHRGLQSFRAIAHGFRLRDVSIP
jgi:hypothetical protein